jgi:mono/diheme cytochrome c family protein
MLHTNSVFSRSRLWREGAILATAAALFLTVSLAGFSQDADKPSDTEKPAATAAGGAKKGDEIFKTKCVICHNKMPGDNSPVGPPNLFEAFKSKAITQPQAEQIIAHGKGQMPGFGTILTKSDIQGVIAYLKAGK